MLNVLRNLKLKSKLPTALIATAIGLLSTSCSGQKFGLDSTSAAFAQKASYISNVDILWVIDSSGSMTPRQAGLAANVPGFITNLNLTGLNYNMAVTTMDMSSAGAKGRFIAQAGTPTVLNAATPNLVATLQARLQPGATGSILEKGMDSVKAGLTTSMLAGANSGFMRSDAILVVIFLSDEDDKSTVFDDVAFFNSSHPPLVTGDKSWVVQFLGVTPTDPTCKTSAWDYTDPGTR